MPHGQLTVLGSCAAWPEPGRACSGLLVEYDGVRLVLDLGFATLPRLLAHCPDGDVDGVVITHAHSDHCVDLNGLLRVRHHGGRASDRIPLLCPPPVAALVDGLEHRPRLAELFDVRALPGTHRVGPFQVTGLPLPHHVPACGVRLVAGDLVVAYSGDTGPHENLVELGLRADLFVVEATLAGGRTDEHLLSARQAGRWASAAGARRLMLTHFWPGSDRAAAVEQARETFAGEVIAAEEGLTVELGTGHRMS
ncbi:MBL fold metallo-hydrolase [Actinophytocola xinjiangensis]|uniref:MBL fold metallo-hydrolase n=1 Tax=Actinophytocola xinjiangensis TaxID=485602 RepID=A0A7Z0WEG2_9PSEU|nr:MBL fold metallo-hydrolase [Actinophytocola xinjiangensis]OLF05049.1 MBL fold metallo-hydrolase [Actinophytocola xinjiangensis]